MSKTHSQTIADYTSFRLIKDILKLIKPYRAVFLCSSFVRCIGDLINLYPPFATASIVSFLTHYQHGSSLRPVYIMLGLLATSSIIRRVSIFFAKYYGYQVAEKIGIDASLKTTEHLFRLNMRWHEKENSGNKIKRIQNGGNGYNEIVRIWFDNIIEIVVNLVAINIVIAQFDHTILFVLFIFLITYFCLAIVMTNKAGEASYRVNEHEEQLNGALFEAINNIRTVKVMAMATSLYLKLKKSTVTLLQKLTHRIFWYQSRNQLLALWSDAFKLGIFALIILGIVNGKYDIAFFILFMFYFGDLRTSIDELADLTVHFVTSKLRIARMNAILNEPILNDDDTDKIHFSPDWKKISVRNVSFSYGGKNILNHISFDVHRGEKIGIVGLSGAGKSTLFKLLCKEREEFTGEILFDNIPLPKIHTNDYFKYVSVVLQDTEVFNFSLKDNIIITNSAQKTNKQLLQQALKTSYIDDFVHKLPKGLNTLIGEKGVKLSGGERQRLGIARAIFKQPQLLLLDEATSHLDLESEEKIRDSLYKFFENVTAIVIAHRLTTIKAMDKILVIEKGNIIESGNFETLYAKHGRFYELWEKQKL